jgi:hypothetical protein
METDTADDDDNDDVDLLSIAEDLCLASALLTSRNNKITEQHHQSGWCMDAFRPAFFPYLARPAA